MIDTAALYGARSMSPTSDLASTGTAPQAGRTGPGPDAVTSGAPAGVDTVHCLVRVWMPDRPGALGQVASRIGAVRGDVCGIEILERGANRAIDELVVSLPADVPIELLVRELTQVDGVDVEDVRMLPGGDLPGGVPELDTACRVVEAPGFAAALDVLVDGLHVDLHADWVVVVDVGGDAPELVASAGNPPAAAWVAAFVAGSRHAGLGSPAGVDDIAHATVGSDALELVVGRSGRPLRSRERDALRLLARMAGTRVR